MQGLEAEGQVGWLSVRSLVYTCKFTYLLLVIWDLVTICDCFYPSIIKRTENFMWELSSKVNNNDRNPEETQKFIGQVRFQIYYSYRIGQKVYTLQRAYCAPVAVWGAV